MFAPRNVAPDTICLPSYMPIPGHGVLGVNTFVIKAREPILVDTCAAALREPFLAALGATIDPSDIRWIWLSHTDADHLGNMREVLALAPKAQVITNFLGMAKMMLLGHDVSRVHLLDPGAELDAGDRRLVPIRPPYYDAPETTGFFDTKSRVLFSADAFGALLSEPAESAQAIGEKDLADGMAAWAGIDAPWLGMLDQSAFQRVLRQIERLDPSAIIAGHLAEAKGMTKRLLQTIAALQPSVPTGGPDHTLIEQLAAGPTAHAAA
jgi:flavorubredoxin